MVSKIGNLEFGAIGLTTNFAQLNNIKPVVEKIEALTHARYYPNAKPMDIKVIMIVNESLVVKYAEERFAECIDTLTLVITEGLTC